MTIVCYLNFIGRKLFSLVRFFNSVCPYRKMCKNNFQYRNLPQHLSYTIQKPTKISFLFNVTNIFEIKVIVGIGLDPYNYSSP